MKGYCHLQATSNEPNHLLDLPAELLEVNFMSTKRKFIKTKGDLQSDQASKSKFSNDFQTAPKTGTSTFKRSKLSLLGTPVVRVRCVADIKVPCCVLDLTNRIIKKDEGYDLYKAGITLFSEKHRKLAALCCCYIYNVFTLPSKGGVRWGLPTVSAMKEIMVL